MVRSSKKIKKIIEESKAIPIEQTFAVYYCTKDGKSIVRFSDFNPQTDFIKVSSVYGISPNFEEISLAAKMIYANPYNNQNPPMDSDGYEEESGLNSIEETTQPQREYSPREMREMVDMYRRMRRKFKR